MYENFFSLNIPKSIILYFLCVVGSSRDTHPISQRRAGNQSIKIT